MKNKYVKGGKISEIKFRTLMKLFSLDLDATQIAGLTGINRNTANRYLLGVRFRISQYCRMRPCACKDREPCNDLFLSADEEDASAIMVIVGLDKSAQIHSRILPKHMEKNMMRGRWPGEKKDADVLRNFQGGIDLEAMKYGRFKSRAAGSLKRNPGIEGCDAFWGFARTRLHRFRGLQKQTLLLHLRECEFRYNHDRNDIYPFLLRMFRENPFSQNDFSPRFASVHIC